jgi:hypothetical protein
VKEKRRDDDDGKNPIAHDQGAVGVITVGSVDGSGSESGDGDEIGDGIGDEGDVTVVAIHSRCVSGCAGSLCVAAT